jgi:transcription antitermination factor NusG
MASSETLTVLDYLDGKGFAVWTPQDHKIGRRPRTRKEYDKRFALMPSYVFAKAERISDLLRLSMVPNTDAPRFTVFRHQGGFPLVSDISLGGLRYEEDRRKGIFDRWRRSRMKPQQIATGTVVRMSDGPFAGLTGEVKEMQGGYALVDIPGFAQPLKIASLLLVDGLLADQKSPDDTAARAA